MYKKRRKKYLRARAFKSHLQFHIQVVCCVSSSKVSHCLCKNEPCPTYRCGGKYPTYNFCFYVHINLSKMPLYFFAIRWHWGYYSHNYERTCWPIISEISWIQLKPQICKQFYFFACQILKFVVEKASN